MTTPVTWVVRTTPPLMRVIAAFCRPMANAGSSVSHACARSGGSLPTACQSTSTVKPSSSAASTAIGST